MIHMQESRFPRAIEEAHEEDMSRRFEGGYVSYRTWLLANEAKRMLGARFDPDVSIALPEAA